MWHILQDVAVFSGLIYCTVAFSKKQKLGEVLGVVILIKRFYCVEAFSE